MKKIERHIRENLKDFARKFSKIHYEQIDWSKPREYVSDRFNNAELPKNLQNNSSQLNFLIKAESLGGGSVIFSITVKRGAKKEDIDVEFSEMRDYQSVGDTDDSHSADIQEEEYTEEERESLERAREFFDNLKSLTKKIKESKKKNKVDRSGGCNSCGRKDLPVTTVIRGDTGDIRYLCSVCMMHSEEATPKDSRLSEIEANIEKYERMANDMEEMIKTVEIPEVPEALSNFAWTPLSLYKSLQAIIAELKSEKVNILSKMELESRIRRELKDALAREDYKKSAELRDKIKQLRKEGDDESTSK